MKYLRLLLLAAVVVPAAGCWYSYQAEDEGDLALASAGMTALKIQTQNGHVKYISTDSAATAHYRRYCRGSSTEEARQHLADIKLTDTLVGAELQVRADCPSQVSRSYGCSFDIDCPQADFDIETSNGAVEVTGAGAGNVSTSNGAVTVTDATGAVNVETSNGRITAVRHTGAFNGHTSNAACECEVVALDSLADSVILHTSNSRVTVNLPATASLSFDLSTSNSDITISGFANVTYTVNEKTHKAGKLNGGRMTLQVETSNSDVDIIGH